MKRLIEAVKNGHLNLFDLGELKVGKAALSNISKAIDKFGKTNFKNGADVSKAAEKITKMIDDLKKVTGKK